MLVLAPFTAAAAVAWIHPGPGPPGHSKLGGVTQPAGPQTTPELDGVRVLVTGGTSGLGFAMSRALAEAGARVILTGRTEQRVQEAARRIGDLVTGLVMDVRDEQSVSASVESALRALGGGIDVLVNNAGIGMRTVNPNFMTDPMGFWQVSPDGFRDLLATNVVGYFLVARAVVPHMLQAGHGKIVNISVNESTMRRRGFTPYGPSRAATDALSHIMAADLAGTGIDVNLLLPGGATRTGMTPDSAPEGVQAAWLDPAIMGPPVCWLASRASDGLTDQRIAATEFAGHGPALPLDLDQEYPAVGDAEGGGDRHRARQPVQAAEADGDRGHGPHDGEGRGDDGWPEVAEAPQERVRPFLLPASHAPDDQPEQPRGQDGLTGAEARIRQARELDEQPPRQRIGEERQGLDGPARQRLVAQDRVEVEGDRDERQAQQGARRASERTGEVVPPRRVVRHCRSSCRWRTGHRQRRRYSVCGTGGETSG